MFQVYEKKLEMTKQTHILVIYHFTDYTIYDFKNLEIEKSNTIKGIAKEKKNDVQQRFPCLTTQQRHYFKEIL